MATKKMVLYGTAIMVSGAVMVTSGISAKASGQEGYQAVKEAMKTTHQLQSAALNGSFLVTDNGQDVLKVAVDGKGSTAQEAASGTVTVEQTGKQSAVSFFHQNGQSVVKFDGDDTYYLCESDMQHKHPMQHGGTHMTGMDPQMEKLLDALVGKYRTYMKLDQGADQTQVVTMSLNDDEIPALLNAAGSLVLEKALSGESDSEDGTDNPFHDKLNLTKPDIGTEVHLEQVEVQMVIDADHYIRQESIKLEASSKDAQGQAHTWTFSSKFDLSGLNQTTADTVNLDGKKVETIQAGHHH